MSQYENEKKAYAKIVVKAWTDDAFREQLLANPKEVLNNHGFQIPAEIAVSIIPDSTHHKVHLGLPAKPPGGGDENDAMKMMFFCIF